MIHQIIGLWAAIACLVILSLVITYTKTKHLFWMLCVAMVVVTLTVVMSHYIQ